MNKKSQGKYGEIDNDFSDTRMNFYFCDHFKSMKAGEIYKPIQTKQIILKI